MALNLTVARIPPMAVDSQLAARQARHIATLIEQAGGVPQATAAAVNVIYAASPDDEPSEIGRLRLLYQRAYTRAELETLVTDTFTDLGLGGP